MIFRKFKRTISQNKFFWKYRHFLPKIYHNPNWKPKTINNIFFEIIDQNKISSIMDFGFGSGDLLLEIFKKRKNNVEFFFGIDINSENLRKIKKIIHGPNTFFEKKIDDKLFKKINDSGIQKIDLIVFDRVLYIFSDNELHELLKSISQLVSFIFIDDFVIIGHLKNSEYKHRNWVKILKDYNFELEIDIDSVNGNPEGCFSRTLLFRKHSTTVE